MSENWIEKYNNYQDREEPLSGGEGDFDLFYKLCAPDHIPVDTEVAWQKLTSQINKKDRPTLSILWKIAATVLIALGSVFTLYLSQNNSGPTYQIISSKEQNKVVTLPDGSLVTLGSYSNLKFSAEAFGETNRHITFDGEGFFEVQKSKVPFTVQTTEARVEVLGTTFSLNTHHKSTKLCVESGLVAFKNNQEQIKLGQGESAIIRNKSNKIERLRTDPNANSWKTGKFEFTEMKLGDAFTYLQKYYKVDFSASESLKSCKITVKFDREPLESVVEVLGSMLNSKGRISDKEVKFAGKGCKE